MNKVKSIGLFIGLFVLSFLFCRWLYMNVFYFYLMPMLASFNGNFSDDFWFSLLLLTIGSLIISTLLYQIIRFRTLSPLFIKVFYGIYFLFLGYFLFFKSIGIQGISLNPFSFITDFISGDSMIVLLNIICFIPLGFLFVLNTKNSLLFLGFILVVEISQYSFHLGFFDAGDIVANFAGFVIGSLIVKSKFYKSIFRNADFIQRELI
ncbi:hypothetical protein BAU15_04340 [Enterococcus sp. JM4C]|uniref:VanZ family protein n=1 Tax=Candidatus Enterococcus huntleyi TaxID=1857217 RepID=UPI00137A9960|nr:VanZ family protein [Enterococcus sp. JM4C]KAF1295769.1 hypothetical protein BAU15_04340 [Enterococcus sp. JM4C]